MFSDLNNADDQHQEGGSTEAYLEGSDRNFIDNENLMNTVEEGKEEEEEKEEEEDEEEVGLEYQRQELQQKVQEHEEKFQEILNAKETMDDTAFYHALNELKKEVRHPPLYANLIRNGAHMDMVCLYAIEQIIEEEDEEVRDMEQGFNLIIKGERTTITRVVGPKIDSEYTFAVDAEGHFRAFTYFDGKKITENQKKFFKPVNTTFNCDCLMNAIHDLSIFDDFYDEETYDSNAHWECVNRKLRESIAAKIETEYFLQALITTGHHSKRLRGRANVKEIEVDWTAEIERRTTHQEKSPTGTGNNPVEIEEKERAAEEDEKATIEERTAFFEGWGKQECLEDEFDMFEQEHLKSLESLTNENFVQLHEFKKKVRSPELYARIVSYGGYMDIISFYAILRILEKKCFKDGTGLSINIKSPGVDLIYILGKKNSSKFDLELKDGHFTINLTTVCCRNHCHEATFKVGDDGDGFDCLLNALRGAIFDFDEIKKNDVIRKRIVLLISTDHFLQGLIMSGFHQDPRWRRFWGGGGKPKNTVEPEKTFTYKTQNYDLRRPMYEANKKSGLRSIQEWTVAFQQCVSDEILKGQLAEEIKMPFDQIDKTKPGDIENCSYLKKMIQLKNAVEIACWHLSTMMVFLAVMDVKNNIRFSLEDVDKFMCILRRNKVSLNDFEVTGYWPLTSGKNDLWIPVEWELKKPVKLPNNKESGYFTIGINLDKPEETEKIKEQHIGFKLAYGNLKTRLGHILIDDNEELPGRDSNGTMKKRLSKNDLKGKVLASNWPLSSTEQERLKEASKQASKKSKSSSDFSVSEFT